MHLLQSGVPFNVIALCGSGTRARHPLIHSSLSRGRSRNESDGACTTRGARHQFALLQGAGLAHPVLASAVTMRRLRRPRRLDEIGAGGHRVVPPAHSLDLRIGVAMQSFTEQSEAALPVSPKLPFSTSLETSDGRKHFRLNALRPNPW